jgi:hypothetical protein
MIAPPDQNIRILSDLWTKPAANADGPFVLKHDRENQNEFPGGVTGKDLQLVAPWPGDRFPCDPGPKETSLGEGHILRCVKRGPLFLQPPELGFVGYEL